MMDFATTGGLSSAGGGRSGGGTCGGRPEELHATAESVSTGQATCS